MKGGTRARRGGDAVATVSLGVEVQSGVGVEGLEGRLRGTESAPESRPDADLHTECCEFVPMVKCESPVMLSRAKGPGDVDGMPG